jgi:UDP-N-acetylglucosamine--N-acetylmuramyl-(pentapeptide) pyrophosphoryl-undecaprenol N-acetylglucosamine transferase
MRVVVAGGGTAGHVEPALALADALVRRHSGVEIVALGTREGLEAKLVPERGFALELMPRVPLPRRPSKEMARLPSGLRAAISRASIVVRGSDVVVGFGGYVSFPAYYAARRARVPFVVHEANAHPGISNRFGARATPFVAIGLRGTRLPHAQLTGTPLRRSIATLDRAAARATALQTFGLTPDRPTLLVFGGSLGARRLNEAVFDAADTLIEAGAQILHAVGEAWGDEHAAPSRDHHVVVTYLDRMDLAYAACDVVVCRAGALTVSEVCALGLPAVYVPLAIGNGEQRENASAVVGAGGAVMVNDDALTADSLRSQVLPLLRNPRRRDEMGLVAATFGISDGDERLADMVDLASAGMVRS